MMDFSERRIVNPQAVIEDLVAQTSRQAKAIHDLSSTEKAELEGFILQNSKYGAYIGKKDKLEILKTLDLSRIHVFPTEGEAKNSIDIIKYQCYSPIEDKKIDKVMQDIVAGKNWKVRKIALYLRD